MRHPAPVSNHSAAISRWPPLARSAAMARDRSNPISSSDRSLAGSMPAGIAPELELPPIVEEALLFDDEEEEDVPLLQLVLEALLPAGMAYICVQLRACASQPL